MKKSKFLKKSLAMLLAVMLVVAMIPMSASAADGPAITAFTVNSAPATISDKTITATVSDATSVSLGAVYATDVTVAYLDKDGNEITSTDGVANGVNLTEKGKKNGNAYELTVKASKTQDGDDATIDTNYTLKITVDTSALSSDATIKAVKTVDDGKNDMVSYQITDKKITITMPFGASAPNLSDGTSGSFVPTSDKVQAIALTNSNKTLTVTAQDGSTKAYAVEVVFEKGFTAFNLPNQTKSEIDSTDGKIVTITMPYETDLTEKMIPTFTKGENILKVTLGAGSAYTDAAVVSGTTKIDFSSTVSFNLWVSKTTAVEVKVTAETPDDNPAAELKDIKVANSNVVEVSGKTVSVEMPAGYDFAAATAIDVVITASAKATVTIPAQGKKAVERGATGVYDITGVNATGKSFIIRVTSEDGETYNDYTVSLTKAKAPEAKITDLTFKGKLDGENVSYSATINGTTATLQKVPYAVLDDDTLATFKVYATTSTGAVITLDGVRANAIAFPNTYTALKAANSVPAFNDTTTSFKYKVVASDDTVVTYTVVFKTDAAQTGKLATSAALVDTNDNSLITSDGSYTASIKKVVNSTDTSEKVNAMAVTVPHSFDTSKNYYFSILNLSKGATAFVTNDNGTNFTKITALDKDAEGMQTAVAPAKIPVDVLNTDGQLIVASATTQIYVVSESNAVNLDPTTDKATIIGKGTKYYLYGVKSDPETGYAIRSMSAPLDTNVKASLSGKTVNITVPNSYDDNVKPTEFSLDFTLSSMAKLYINSVAPGNVVVPNQSNEDKVGVTMFTVKGEELYVGATKVTGFVVEAENETTNPYSVSVNTADAETGATITALKVGNQAATINGKTITITMPYNTKLNPLKLDITASKMAKIEIGGAEYKKDLNYDLNSDLAIKVISEDKNTVNVYTLKATTAAQFSDVKEGKWYYDYVMAAAAAGIVKGNGDGTFGPEKNVTRRDFAVMLVNMLGVNVDSYTDSAFKDVEDTDYAMKSIAYLKDKGIIDGYTDGTFKPKQTISREEAAKLVAVALDLKGTTTEKFKDDAKIAGWAKTYVYATKAAGIFNGDEKGNFNAKSMITRAETAKAMVDAQKIK